MSATFFNLKRKNMESNISLFEYLAYNVPEDCQMVLQRNDIPTANNIEELVEGLKLYVREYQHEALDELADIHPDRELIESLLEFSTPYKGKKESEFLNAAGTLSLDTNNSRLNNIENSLLNKNTEKEINPSLISKMDVLFGLGIAILTATLFRKNS
tara:strand:- start:750 stop:1220 length:471 start_codon:yes stop_codon:yes gene_type:complete